MDIVHPSIDRYLHDLSSPEDPILREMEVAAAEQGFPIVGPAVGRLLAILAQTMGATRVLELGSGFGYSAYWFARAVGPKGKVVLTESSAARASQAEEFLNRGGFRGRFEIHVGDALQIAAPPDNTDSTNAFDAPFDIVFNDIDKEHYPQVLEPATHWLRPGGLLLSDNMLWFGTVLEQQPSEASTRGVQQLTQRLINSPLFETSIVPIRDGVSVSLRRPD